MRKEREILEEVQDTQLNVPHNRSTKSRSRMQCNTAELHSVTRIDGNTHGNWEGKRESMCVSTFKVLSLGRIQEKDSPNQSYFLCLLVESLFVPDSETETLNLCRVLYSYTSSFSSDVPSGLNSSDALFLFPRTDKFLSFHEQVSRKNEETCLEERRKLFSSDCDVVVVTVDLDTMIARLLDSI